MCILRHFEVGDNVRDGGIEDGVHVGYGGVVVVKDGVFVAEFECLIDKYGGTIEIDKMIDERNPISRYVNPSDTPTSDTPAQS